MADDFPAELQRAYDRIEGLEGQLQLAKLFERKLRNKAWWKTYRAVLTGIYSNAEDYGNASPIDMHNSAAQAATLAHGPIDGRTE